MLTNPGENNEKNNVVRNYFVDFDGYSNRLRVNQSCRGNL